MRRVVVIRPSAGSTCTNRTDPPPLPLTIHLTDLLRIYLAAIPPSLMCVASGWTLVIMSVIAGWCFLGLEALVADVGGVFGQSGKLCHRRLVPLLTLV